MNKENTLIYIPLDIEIVEVKIEKGYAASQADGNSLNEMGFDGNGW